MTTMYPGETNTGASGFTILNHVPLGVCIIDRNYTVIFWNTVMEEWCGVTNADITGRSISSVFRHFSEPRYTSRLETIFDGGAPAIFSSQLHCDIFPSMLPNGEPRILHTIVTAVPSPADDGWYAMFAVTDTSELTSRILDYRTMRDKALQEIEQRKRAEEEKEILIGELKDALNNVKTLSGMLPICASCKKIRDDKGYWQQVEKYVSMHVPVSFTHSICPDCAKKLYPQYYDKITERKKPD
jgi:PAS domain S-box-containing protein